ncbi:MAG TPA: phospholipase [Solirubrobacteraceae bacterium]|nr:phospholipase [Solirubrobacteraceae bacterium]
MSDAAGVLPHRLRPAAGEPQGALVLMHGRGTSEDDLFPLLDVLDPRRRLLGVAPGGPLHLPPGGRHWYAVRRVGHPDPATFAQGFGALTAFLDGLGLDWSRTVLGGFSQGSVMAYATGLGEGRPLPAGIVALSGFVPTVEGWRMRDDVPPGFPVAIGHGTHDEIISVDFGRAARDRLQAAGADVTYHESPIAHTIDPRFLGGLPEWVDGVVPPG